MRKITIILLTGYMLSGCALTLPRTPQPHLWEHYRVYIKDGGRPRSTIYVDESRFEQVKQLTLLIGYPAITFLLFRIAIAQ